MQLDNELNTSMRFKDCLKRGYNINDNVFSCRFRKVSLIIMIKALDNYSFLNGNNRGYHILITPSGVYPLTFY